MVLVLFGAWIAGGQFEPAHQNSEQKSEGIGLSQYAVCVCR